MTDPGHVLHLGKAYPPWIGGVETHIADLSRELVRRGWRVHVLAAASSATESFEIRDGVMVHRLPCRGRLWSQPLVQGYIRRCRQLARQADIVHLHVPNPLGQLATLFLPKHVPLIVTWHSDIVRQQWLSPVIGPIENHSLHRTRYVIATSPNYVQSSRRLQFFGSKVKIIPLGIDLERFDVRLQSAQTIVSNWQNQYPRPITLSVGRLVPYKGFDVLIRAFRNISGSLVIVGDGPLRQNLMALADQIGVRNRLYIIPSTNDVELAAFYRLADLFVLPSIQRSEAFGIVQLEAFSAGIPVVSTNLSTGVPWVNRHGETGFTVPPGDVEALAISITRLLDDSSIRTKMGATARKRVEEHFSNIFVVSQIEQLYTESIREIQ